MFNFKLGDTGGLVQSKIVPRRVTYYLVTSDNLNSVKSKSILSDVFTLLASLCGELIYL